MSTIERKPLLHGRDHVPGGADPIPGWPDPFGEGIEDILLSKSAVGLWKLNETSGDTAADSSGAGNHMTVEAMYAAPTWGEAAGPPGTTSALFTRSGGSGSGGSRLDVAMPSGMVDDFSAGLWVYVNSTAFAHELLGQGAPFHSGPGWELVYNTTDKFALSTGGSIAECNNTSAIDAWYLFGVSRIAGTWTLYLDGLAQADTDTTTPSAETATWIGDDGFGSANHGCDQTLSWAFITDDPLDGADWLALYEAGQTGGAPAAGSVWQTDGAGGASFQPNINTLAKSGSTALTGAVTLSAGSNVTLTQAGQDISIAATGGGTFDPADATTWWFPLVDADGTCVLDGDDNLIPTLIPI